MDKKALEQMLNGIVPNLSEILNSPEYSKKLLLTLRQVYSKEEVKGVSIVTCTKKPHCLTNILNNYASQSYQEKELIIILNRDDMNLDQWRREAQSYSNVSVYQLPQEVSLGECHNFAVDRTKHEFIATFDDDDYYGPNYLNDLMNAFRYTDADIVGKSSYYSYIESLNALVLRNPHNEYQYIDFVGGGKRIVKRKVFDYVRFPALSVQEDKLFCRECVDKGFKIFSTDNYNLVYLRTADPFSHTWKISDEEMLARCSLIAYTNDYKSYVTV